MTIDNWGRVPLLQLENGANHYTLSEEAEYELRTLVVAMRAAEMLCGRPLDNSPSDFSERDAAALFHVFGNYAAWALTDCEFVSPGRERVA